VCLLISVIIPSYNRADLIARALDSVLRQTTPPTEVIVVDDCSTDDTPRALEAFGARVRTIRTPTNIERGAARNLGARLSTGTILAFLDSDDEWEPAKLSAQLPHAVRGHASVTGIVFIDGDGCEVAPPYVPSSSASRRILLENQYLGSPSSLLLPRAMFDAVGGFPEEREVQGSEDWLFLAKLLSAHDVSVVPEPLVRYRVHTANSTADPARVAGSMWSATEWMARHELMSGSVLRRSRARTAGTIGRGYAARRQWRSALAWAVRAFRDGSVAEALRSAALVLASSGRALLRRRGSRAA
jgi:glycosyltransferase involved in cell wall biosynthesis